ncbi:hypothetical protein HN51_033793 [Arachis hypogaea]|uniref:Glycine-rich protein n=1 Tax=Arachis hypogaea TaxID=3818 RepID=A0A445AAK3_ARAHY|nr:putative glycine-rich cell wall structural protein 1 [Arachis ipaensis]XP_025641561.1 putative glycine-rich cell wall structural protein 1 [Arachis hypogaea]QHN98521.1 uncharacterized protein DS421_13g390280 [Arachis hypogaea]RYR23439.1 hypothetical protein Ahy_B03g068662 [Arachis hypogaea]
MGNFFFKLDKHALLLIFYLVLFYLDLPLPVNSQHQRNSSHAADSETIIKASAIVSVDRRGGGGGHGGGGHGGGGHGVGGHSGSDGHGSSKGMNGDHSNLPIPLYGAAAGSAGYRNNDHHHGTSNGILNSVYFYHYFLLFIPIVTLFEISKLHINSN